MNANSRMNCFIVLICILSYSKSIVKSTPVNEKRSANPLLVISFDGFRWDYLQRTLTPNFDKLIKNGVQAKFGMKNAFVTKTFPNHFTLATGLWEESHGIIANEMYDPFLNQSFSPGNKLANQDPAWFDVGGEPIWVTNQIQKKHAQSGVIMWVGGEAPVRHILPSRHMPYDGLIKNETKIDTLVSWFTDKKNPINLGMLYFDEPDMFGHQFGPESPQVTGMIGGLDEVMGYLLQKLKETGLLDKMNIIVLSDHGFTSTPAENVINLDDYIDTSVITVSDQSPIAFIWPSEDKLEDIYTKLKAGAVKNGNFNVYKKEDIPIELHYNNNQRISPIVAVAKDTCSFETKEYHYTNKGNHGYDNRLQDMHPFFLAMGPAFKKGFTVDTFNNVDIYPLMCHLLGLTPAPNNGSMEVVGTLLVDTKTVDMSDVTFYTYMGAAGILAIVAGLFICGIVRLRRSTDGQTIQSSDPTTEVPSAAVTAMTFTFPQHPTSDADSRTPLLTDIDDG